MPPPHMPMPYERHSEHFNLNGGPCMIITGTML